MEQILITREQVETLTSFSRSFIYKLMSTGDFPRPVKVAAHSVRWRRKEVIDWIENRQRSTGAAA